MSAPVTIDEALRELVAAEGVTRCDIGYSVYGYPNDKPYSATVWFDVPPERPSDIYGCASAMASSIDEAVTIALGGMAREIKRCAEHSMAEAA